MALVACNTKPPQKFIFNSQDLSRKQFSQAEAECNLEAEKAAMLATNSISAGDRWKRIFVLCMEAKGAKYVGTTDQIPGSQRNPG
ncbi:hypothetical protein DC522_04285 [Microvirga sp. KLBC 81]|nr:hypothetical protein DC522_04285 [Microvirga sp. KLBC 81]